ncbi:hypothetical protein [Microbulbifer sp. TYP-18]|uniref:hypothetical protein n=1 Tax=Microbulbifer sp. TYP-18 TaxID=3230024 RepID=UPI0034C639A5
MSGVLPAIGKSEAAGWQVAEKAFPSRLLKKASCLFQNAKSEKCNFHFSPKINDLGIADFAGTSMFRYQASKFFEFQQPASEMKKKRGAVAGPRKVLRISADQPQFRYWH